MSNDVKLSFVLAAIVLFLMIIIVITHGEEKIFFAGVQTGVLIAQVALLIKVILKYRK